MEVVSTPKREGRGGNRRRNRSGRGKAASNNGKSDQPEIKKEAAAPRPTNSAPKSAKHLAHLSAMTFASLDGISANSKKAIAEVLKFEHLSIVQAKTFPHIMARKDVLAKAKTGTGKTVGFLLPSLERVLSERAAQPAGSKRIAMLVISPTRELASQIATEAKQLCTFHPGMGVAVFVGGTNINKDHTALRGAVDILVATPGRLLDHLENSRGFKDRLAAMSVLVLDEADQLLEQGFRIELEKIMRFLPTQRQTLLFSATVPSQLEAFIRTTLKADHEFVNTVSAADEQTNSQVKQSSVVCPLADHIQMLDAALQSHIAAATSAGLPYKVIVFFSTARGAGFYAQLFNRTSMKVIEMHSRKPQGYRTKASARFRDTDNLVMFSSDVSARGMDYDGVSLVLQVGLTERAQYIHRLGRTARAGMEGQGVIMVSPFETCILKELKDLPIEPMPTAEIEALCATPLRAELAEVVAQVHTDEQLTLAATQAYQAWLGYYNSNGRKLKMSKTTLVEIANQYAEYIGLTEQPTLQAKTVGKMGLRDVPGLKVAKGPSGGGGGRGGRGGRSGGGGGRGGGGRGRR